jgi:CheY-like chemotaxis protein
MARILIVEDDGAVARVLRVLLEMRGHEVLAANNGARGILSAQHQAPDVIILDLMMPVMDGFGVMDALSQDELTAKIPVIVLSAMHSASVEQRCSELGASHYMRKPFDAETLIGVVEELVSEVQTSPSALPAN